MEIFNLKKLLYKILDTILNLVKRTDAITLDDSRITLDSYTINDYIFPSDGYLFIACNAAYNASAFATIKDSEGTSIALIGCGNANGTYAAWSTFVKKGMRARMAEVNNSGHVYFIPLK